MRIVHLSDLHIGKRVNEFNLLEDQEYILFKILRIIDDYKPEVVIIAGDVYDKAIPNVEAVTMFDNFLAHLSKRHLKTFIISGNHDSPERLSFGSVLMKQSGVYIFGTYNGKIDPIILTDDYGDLNIYLLPFIKPVHVRQYFPDSQINNYTQALRVVIDSFSIDTTKRNILVTHQFIIGSEICDSEELSVGGTDGVDVSVFEGFDYVALGHLHGPQSIGKETIRYSGSPLKYSFSETNHNKSVVIIDFKNKGEISLQLEPLVAKRDMKQIKGTYEELTSKSFYSLLNTDDYYQITLTDEEDVFEAINKLRVIYPNIMRLDYDNTRTRENKEINKIAHFESKTPFDLVSEFYELQNNQKLSEEQENLCKDLIEKIWQDNL